MRARGVRKFGTKNNERPETLSSSGRPGSPPPELLINENSRLAGFCIWHFRAMNSTECATFTPH